MRYISYIKQDAPAENKHFPANSTDLQGYIVKVIANKHEMITVTVKRQERRLDGNYSKTRSSHDDLTFSCYTCDIYIIIEKSTKHIPLQG